MNIFYIHKCMCYQLLTQEDDWELYNKLREFSFIYSNRIVFTRWCNFLRN